MSLTKGILASIEDPRHGALPIVVEFQYNPSEVTRVFSGEDEQEKGSKGGALNASRPAPEGYSLKLELDATGGSEAENPVTTELGIAPKLAAIEALMQPVSSSKLGSLARGLLGKGGVAIPATRLPLVLLVWGAWRVTPVQLVSLTIGESAYDEALNPIHASAELGFTVLRADELGKDETIARAAALYYETQRELKAAQQLIQSAELGS